MKINFYLLLFTVAILKLNAENLLLESINKKDLAETKKLISAGVNLNEKFENGATALHYAINQKNEEAAILLLENGAKYNVMDNDENTPLSLSRKFKLKNVEKKISELFIKGAHFSKTDLSKDKHFIFLVASYNNVQWYKKNLDSIFSQNYKNYTVIYMDDISTDNTANFVQNYINKKFGNNNGQFIFIKNKQKKYCLRNYLFAVKRFCPDNAILITLDGDDWLADKNVLSYLNIIYKNSNIWLTYGSSIIYPSNKKYKNCQSVEPKNLEKGRFREIIKKTIYWPIHHLRSFYTALFRKIKYKDLLDQNNKFFTYTEDVAFMLPMLEMAKEHFKYIPVQLYVYNERNPLLTKKVYGVRNIVKNLLFICNKKFYNSLTSIDI